MSIGHAGNPSSAMFRAPVLDCVTVHWDESSRSLPGPLSASHRALVDDGRNPSRPVGHVPDLTSIRPVNRMNLPFAGVTAVYT